MLVHKALQMILHYQVHLVMQPQRQSITMWKEVVMGACLDQGVIRARGNDVRALIHECNRIDVVLVPCDPQHRLRHTHASPSIQ